jgi:hypothetical protein
MNVAPLGRAVDRAASEATVRARHRSGHDNRAAIRNDGDGVLDQEECTLDVDVEMAVVESFVDCSIGASLAIPVLKSSFFIHGN